VDLTTIPGVARLNLPASAASIGALGPQLPAELPEDYATLLGQSDGVQADGFILYSSAEMPERNETYEVGEYATGYIAIGDDNGGRAIMMRGGSGRSPVFLVGHGIMQQADMIEVARSLPEWVAAGCPLDIDA
jgi:hypothetical protein